jgi:hypothetical protein
VIAAAVSTFVIGGLWYSPLLFHKPWMAANGFTEADLRKGNTAAIFGFAFVFALVMAYNLAAFLDAPDTTTAWGATAGLLAAIWVFLGIATVALFRAAAVERPLHQRRLLGRVVRGDGDDHRRLEVAAGPA